MVIYFAKTYFAKEKTTSKDMSHAKSNGAMKSKDIAYICITGVIKTRSMKREVSRFDHVGQIVIWFSKQGEGRKNSANG